MIVSNARIWTNDGDLIDSGYVRFSGGEITEVGPMPAPAAPGEVTLDAAGKLLMPGLVNAHTHLYSTLARGMAIDGVEPYSFYDILAQIWWRLDKALTPEANYYSGVVGAAEMLKSGVTTLIDHHASPNAIDGSLGQLKKAVVDEVGLRACLCYEVTDRDGPERAQAGIAENFSNWDHAAQRTDGMVGALIGLHASFTVSDQTLNDIAKQVGSRNVGYHIHVAEGQEDGVDANVKHHKRTVFRLKDMGILSKNTLFAHCIHLSEPEKDLIAESGAMVSNQPQSNMNNAVGATDVPGLLARGVLLGLGNDGFGSNLLDDLKALYLVQKHQNADPKTLGLGQAHQILFQNNYAIAERVLGVKLGKIKPDYQADFILVNYNPPTPLRADNMMGHLVFGLCSQFDVSAAFVAGRPVLQDRALTGIDMNDLYANARQQAQALWRRIV